MKKLRIGDKAAHWKGDKVGYYGIHIWLKKTFGKATKCEQCGILGDSLKKKWNIEWALVKGKEYQRKRENFIMLCRKCHMIYDNLMHQGWNKGSSLWLGKSNKGISLSTKHKLKLSLAKKGKPWTKARRLSQKLK